MLVSQENVGYNNCVCPRNQRAHPPGFGTLRYLTIKGVLTLLMKTSDKGTIDIANDVFSNIVGDAASSCFGVKGMASQSKESGIWQLLVRESMSKGVTVHYSEDGTVAVELHIVVDHGVNLSAVSESIMSEVSYKVTAATGVIVNQVDVYIDSMNMD